MKNFHFFMFITFNEFKAARYIIHYFPLTYQFRLITHLHLELRNFHLLHTTIHYLIILYFSMKLFHNYFSLLK